MPPVKPPREPGTGPRCHIDRAKLEAAFDAAIKDVDTISGTNGSLAVVILAHVKASILKALS